MFNNNGGITLVKQGGAQTKNKAIIPVMPVTRERSFQNECPTLKSEKESDNK